VPRWPYFTVKEIAASTAPAEPPTERLGALTHVSVEAEPDPPVSRRQRARGGHNERARGGGETSLTDEILADVAHSTTLLDGITHSRLR
jgi:hypothetical protein